MATELKSRTEGVRLTRFWGGDSRGVCVQVGAGWNREVQLTREQAAELAHDLMAFADGLETEEDFGELEVDKDPNSCIIVE